MLTLTTLTTLNVAMMLTLTLTTLMTTLTLNVTMTMVMVRELTMSTRVDVVTTLPSATTMIKGYPVPVMSVTTSPARGHPGFRGLRNPGPGGGPENPDFGVLAERLSKRVVGPEVLRAGARAAHPRRRPWRGRHTTRNPGSAISAMFRTGRPPARAAGGTPRILRAQKKAKNGHFLTPAANSPGGVGGLRPLT